MAKTNTNKKKTPARAPAKTSPKKSAKPPVALRAIKGGKTAEKTKPEKAMARIAPTPAAPDDVPVIALNLAGGKLSPAMTAYFKKCQDKLGFIPNVLAAYAFDNTKLEAFVALYNDLMLGESGLSKLEREMIAVAVSSQNRCYYCLASHGASVRQYSMNPLLGEQLVMNYRVARIGKRERAMLDFAVKLTTQPWTIEEADRERLRRAGFSDRDIWDISAVAAFFNMSNRVASATDMRPNPIYHKQAR
ncbi:MAG: peroxidase-related enzyme [Pseudolabrys sp.]|nr:peroxidase-related enzyme [Pseudolabrys sp.]